MRDCLREALCTLRIVYILVNILDLLMIINQSNTKYLTCAQKLFITRTEQKRKTGKTNRKAVELSRPESVMAV